MPKYYFTLNAALTSTRPRPIDVPGGTRVHVFYASEALPPGAAFTNTAATDVAKYPLSWNGRPFDARLGDPTKDEVETIEKILKTKDRPGVVDALRALEQTCRGRAGGASWIGLDGKVVTGGDTVFVRDDGVMVFDARFTMKDGDVLMDATASGVVDLKETLRARTGAEAYAAFRQGSERDDLEIPVHVTLRIEVPKAPGSEAEYAAKRYILQSLRAWKFEALGRQQFAAYGKVFVDGSKPFWPAKGIKIDVYSADTTVQLPAGMAPVEIKGAGAEAPAAFNFTAVTGGTRASKRTPPPKS